MKAQSIKKYLKPSKIAGRWTTFNGAMQAALAVPEAYDPERHAEALRLLGLDNFESLRCVYCGEPAKTWDHLENNVRGGRFSGFGHRIFNLVPACRTCNEKKGGKHWRDHLEKCNPPDKSERTRRLEAFAQRNDAERFGWAEIEREFPELAAEYDQLRADIREKLEAADRVAERIREKVARRLSKTERPEGGPSAGAHFEHASRRDSARANG